MNSAPARRVGLRRILPNHGDKSPSHSFKTSAKGANGFWPNYRQYFPLPFADRCRADAVRDHRSVCQRLRSNAPGNPSFQRTSRSRPRSGGTLPTAHFDRIRVSRKSRLGRQRLGFFVPFFDNPASLMPCVRARLSVVPQKDRASAPEYRPARISALSVSSVVRLCPVTVGRSLSFSNTCS
jgi:hypothetical protein